MALGCGFAAFIVGQNSGRQGSFGQRRSDGIHANFRGPLRGEASGESFDRALGGGDTGVHGHAAFDSDSAEENDGGGRRFFEGRKSKSQCAGSTQEIDFPVGQEFLIGKSMEGFEVDRARAVDQAIKTLGNIEGSLRVGGLESAPGSGNDIVAL